MFLLALAMLVGIGFWLVPRVVNQFGDVGKEVAYMQAHSSFSTLQLVLGTEPFTTS